MIEIDGVKLNKECILLKGNISDPPTYENCCQCEFWEACHDLYNSSLTLRYGNPELIDKFSDYIEKNNKSLMLNLGTEKGTTVKEIIEAARKITGKPIPAGEEPRRPGDPASLYTTSKLAKELLGWEPKYSDVDTLVKTTWEVYRN